MPIKKNPKGQNGASGIKNKLRKSFDVSPGMLEKHLHETQIKFRAVMQSSLDAIILVDAESKIVS